MAAVVAAPDTSSRDADLFHSVFPRPQFTTPTPEATPRIGTYSSPIQSFVGDSKSLSTSDDIVAFSRAWSIITRYLTLQPGIEWSTPRVPDEHVRNAFSIILASEASQKELLAWYINEVNAHFRVFVRPLLSVWDEPISSEAAANALQTTIQVLQTAQRNCYLAEIDSGHMAAQEARFAANCNRFYFRVRSALHTTVLHSLPRHRLQKTLATCMFQQLSGVLQRKTKVADCLRNGDCQCKLHLQPLPMLEMGEVGIGGLVGERAFAHAIHRFLAGPAIERRCFAVDWSGHSSVVPRLKTWVERHLSPVVQKGLGALSENPYLKLTHTDTQQFVSMAVSNLGQLRTRNLFDYVKSWPASMGAVLDIREYLLAGVPADKARVCQSFSDQVQSRLLHAGASTSEILSIYVNVIHVFRTLDSRGVLLDKVALPIRNYLRSREDSVNVVAASLLADVANLDPDKACVDIAVEVASSAMADSREKTTSWDDMEWVPDPIDAGPDYKSSQSEGVIAYVLGLFDQEDFIKEVTNVLAQHLLQGTDPEFVKETRLVELLKSRLDASKLQAAEVMLKDMRDSVTLGKRINPLARYDSIATTKAPPTPREIQAAIPDEGITLTSLYQGFADRIKGPQFMAAVKLVATKRNDLFFAKRTRIPAKAGTASGAHGGIGDLTFRAHVLSSFFWPELRSDGFDISLGPAALQATFESSFDALGSQRKLHFRPALARATLRLDLEDRTVEEHDVSGWRASVIDAFSSERLQTDGLRREELAQMLRMEEDLVQDALNFWSSKNVLYQPEIGVYAVLERLDMDRGTASLQTTAPEELISAVVSQDAVMRESAPMFSTFIANMLRNQGAKQIGGMMGITSLLKMVLPTFTYGDDEVAWLLGEMETKGEVVRNGDLWSVVG